MKVYNMRRAFAAVTVMAMASLVAPATAQAHDWVISSVPAEGDALTEFPDEVELNFSGELRPNFNTIAISDTDTQEVLFTGEPTLDGRLIHIDLPEDLDPGDGNYQVGFQITSSDGHSTRGQVGFSVEGASASAEADDQESDVEPLVEEDDSGIPGWAIGVGVGVVVLIVAVVAGVAAVTRKKG